jgi:molecular chaperone DnaK
MEEVEARNRLDGIVYQAEKMVRENRDKIAEGDAKSLEAAIEDAKKAMSEGEGGTARLRSATENIERELHKVAEVLYKSSQAAGAAQAGAAGAGAGASSGPNSGSAGGSQQKKPDDVIDAEYVDVDESKRPN